MSKKNIGHKHHTLSQYTKMQVWTLVLWMLRMILVKYSKLTQKQCCPNVTCCPHTIPRPTLSYWASWQLSRKQFSTNFTLCAFENSHHSEVKHFLVVHHDNCKLSEKIGHKHHTSSQFTQMWVWNFLLWMLRTIWVKYSKLSNKQFTTNFTHL